ncbi:MAG: putative heat shock protein [Firmicutes bacterium]|nr:putative heat shock protein [Bacillota bacterium]MDI6706595.1 Hsp20/alpha crystallin family protein [Bacillota bacterium]
MDGQTMNQQISPGAKQVRFAPIATNFTNVGTTVTYGVQDATGINAFNAGTSISGNAGFFPQTPWSAFAYNNVQPIISAGQYNQPVSGMHFGYNQQFRYIQPAWNTLIQPNVDISETSSDVVVSAYVPNINLNNTSLNVTENSVTISASAWMGNQNVVLNRTVALPTSIRAEAADATIQNSGVLEIRLPKAEKGVRNRTAGNQSGA